LADFFKTLAQTLVEFTQEKQFCPKNFPNCFVDKKQSPQKQIIDYFWGEYFKEGIF
jgi:hypothetical protein